MVILNLMFIQTLSTFKLGGREPSKVQEALEDTLGSSKGCFLKQIAL